MHPLQVEGLQKKPNRKMDLFFQIGKIYFQVQVVTSGGTDWISTLIFTPEQTWVTTQWPCVALGKLLNFSVSSFTKWGLNSTQGKTQSRHSVRGNYYY